MKYIGGSICKTCKYDYSECEMSSSEILTDSMGAIVECYCYEDKTTINDIKTSKVDHPSHYNQNKVEVIDSIKNITGDKFEGYLLGNIVKYIGRYQYKNGVEDLKKAVWHLEKLIKEIEEKEIQK